MKEQDISITSGGGQSLSQYAGWMIRQQMIHASRKCKAYGGLQRKAHPAMPLLFGTSLAKT